MERFQARFSQTTGDGLDAAQRRSGHAATWSGRSQDQVSGQTSPATVNTAETATVATAGHRLTASEQDVAGPLMHYGFGTAVGAVYGALAETRPELTRFGGVPFGLGVWASADEVAVPAAGLSVAPWDRPLRAHSYSMLSHAVYGLTAEAVRKMVRSRLR
jgi:putative membrane protein